MNAEHTSKRLRIALLIAVTAAGLLLGVASRKSRSSAASTGRAPTAQPDRSDKNRQVHTLLAIQPYRAAILGDDTDEPMFDEPPVTGSGSNTPIVRPGECVIASGP